MAGFGACGADESVCLVVVEPMSHDAIDTKGPGVGRIKRTLTAFADVQLQYTCVADCAFAVITCVDALDAYVFRTCAAVEDTSLT